MATELDGFREQCVTLSGVVRELTVELDACRASLVAQDAVLSGFLAGTPHAPLQQENAQLRQLLHAQAEKIALLEKLQHESSRAPAALPSWLNWLGAGGEKPAKSPKKSNSPPRQRFLLPPPRAGGALPGKMPEAPAPAPAPGQRVRADTARLREAVATGGGDSGDQAGWAGAHAVARALNRELHATTEVSREAAKGLESFLESALSAISPEPVGRAPRPPSPQTYRPGGSGGRPPPVDTPSDDGKFTTLGAAAADAGHSGPETSGSSAPRSAVKLGLNLSALKPAVVEGNRPDDAGRAPPTPAHEVVARLEAAKLGLPTSAAVSAGAVLAAPP